MWQRKKVKYQGKLEKWNIWKMSHWLNHWEDFFQCLGELYSWSTPLSCGIVNVLLAYNKICHSTILSYLLKLFCDLAALLLSRRETSHCQILDSKKGYAPILLFWTKLNWVAHSALTNILSLCILWLSRFMFNALLLGPGYMVVEVDHWSKHLGSLTLTD